MRRNLTLLWLVLLGGSHLWIARRAAAPADPGAGPGRRAVVVPAMDARGPVAEAGAARLSLQQWPAAGEPQPDGPPRTPVLCLHGSPGSARNFEDLGPRLARTGRDVWALDLPGFGRSAGEVPSYGARAHARSALAALDALGIERAHVVAWSMGGAVALHMVELAPGRIASLALLASLGVQEAEGSGSYAFEHFKYALLWVGLVALPELVPHFGLLGPRAPRVAFVRNFWDTDQRPLRAILAGLRTPLLLVHGRSDFLVPAWAAEESHAIARASRLVLLDAGHFLPLGEPFGQADAVLAELAPFLARHDAPGAREPRALVERSRGSGSWLALAPPAFDLARRAPWWLQLGLVAGAILFSPTAVPLAAGTLAGGMQLDVGLALVACALGGALAGARARSKPMRGALAAVGLALAALAISGAALAAWSDRVPPLLLIAVAWSVLLGLVLLAREVRGRRRLRPAPGAVAGGH